MCTKEKFKVVSNKRTFNKFDMGVSKNRGTQKMDGENKGNPIF